MTKVELFRSLHQPGNPLLLANAWNVQSARIFEKCGYKALATSSAAIANSLGYEDGEKINFHELLFIVELIAANTSLPLTVDLESGYGTEIDEVINNIEQLHQVGVVGANLEDSDRNQPQRALVPATQFADKISQLKAGLKKKEIDFFINARTDAYIVDLPGAKEITLERIKAYDEAGADGIFVPFVAKEDLIAQFTKATKLPVNILFAPDLPSFTRLGQLGVARISMGTSAFRATYAHLERMAKDVLAKDDFSPLVKIYTA
jgi:2-methylisocitrate lyase-like PEP mutase family enzyme